MKVENTSASASGAKGQLSQHALHGNPVVMKALPDAGIAVAPNGVALDGAQHAKGAKPALKKAGNDGQAVVDGQIIADVADYDAVQGAALDGAQWSYPTSGHELLAAAGTGESATAVPAAAPAAAATEATGTSPALLGGLLVAGGLGVAAALSGGGGGGGSSAGTVSPGTAGTGNTGASGKSAGATAATPAAPSAPAATPATPAAPGKDAGISTIKGVVMAGPLVAGHGLSVTLYKSDGKVLADKIAVGADGTYTASYAASYTGPVLAKVVDTNSAPDYIDESSGKAKNLDYDLRAVFVSAGPGTSTIAITPLTELAVRSLGLKGGATVGKGASDATLGSITAAQVNDANQAVAAKLGLGADLFVTPVAAVDAQGKSVPNANLSGYLLAAVSGAEALHGAAKAQDLLIGALAAKTNDALIGHLIAGAREAGDMANADYLGALVGMANTSEIAKAVAAAGAISNEKLAALTAADLAALSPAIIAGLSAGQIAKIPAAAAAGFSPDQLHVLTGGQLKSMPDDIAFTADQMKALDAAQQTAATAPSRPKRSLPDAAPDQGGGNHGVSGHEPPSAPAAPSAPSDSAPSVPAVPSAPSDSTSSAPAAPSAPSDSAPPAPVVPSAPSDSAPSAPAAPSAPSDSTPPAPAVPSTPSDSTPSAPAVPSAPSDSTPSAPAAPSAPSDSTPPAPAVPSTPSDSTPSAPAAPSAPSDSTPPAPAVPSAPSDSAPSAPAAPSAPSDSTPPAPAVPSTPSDSTPSAPAVPSTPSDSTPPAPVVPSAPSDSTPPAPAVPSTPSDSKPPAPAVPSAPSDSTPPAPVVPSAPSDSTPPAQAVPSAPSDSTPPAPVVPSTPSDSTPPAPAVPSVPSDSAPPAPAVPSAPSDSTPPAPAVPSTPSDSTPSAPAVPSAPSDSAPPAPAVPSTPSDSTPPAPAVPSAPSESTPPAPVVPSAPSDSAPPAPAVPSAPSDSAPPAPAVPSTPSDSTPPAPAVPSAPSESTPPAPVVPSAPSDSTPPAPAVPSAPSESTPPAPVAPSAPSDSAPPAPAVPSAPSESTPSAPVVPSAPSNPTPPAPVVPSTPSDSTPPAPAVPSAPSESTPPAPVVPSAPSDSTSSVPSDPAPSLGLKLDASKANVLQADPGVDQPTINLHDVAAKIGSDGVLLFKSIQAIDLSNIDAPRTLLVAAEDIHAVAAADKLYVNLASNDAVKVSGLGAVEYGYWLDAEGGVYDRHWSGAVNGDGGAKVELFAHGGAQAEGFGGAVYTPSSKTLDLAFDQLLSSSAIAAKEDWSAGDNEIVGADLHGSKDGLTLALKNDVTGVLSLDYTGGDHLANVNGDGMKYTRLMIGTGAGDTIDASANTGNQALFALGGDNKVSGGAGSDLLLVSGAGDNTLTGGAGADTFRWAKGATGNDAIKDFSKTEGDHIDLSGLLGGKGVNAGNASGYISFEKSGEHDVVLKVDLNGGGSFSDSSKTITLEGAWTDGNLKDEALASLVSHRVIIA